MDQQFVLQRYGATLDLGHVVAGKNLNLLVLRGHARLDQLALISAPDVYDQQNNPEGTQRELKRPHAQACMDYAIESLANIPQDEPHFFPEILLNARDLNCVEVIDPRTPDLPLSVTSFTSIEELPSTVLIVRVQLSALSYPKARMKPQISRVDGNHRLFGADEVLDALARGEDDLDDSFPTVPFSLLLGLSTNQEARLFRDINGEHVGMEVAHLATLAVRTHTEAELKSDPELIPLWIANELTKPGRAFEGMVFFGGSKSGVKESAGRVPPLKINSLRSTVSLQLSAAPTVMAALGGDPAVLLNLVDNYWKAVRTTYTTAWHNKRDFILLQAIGLGGFAKFGGTVLEEAVSSNRVKESDFETAIRPAATVSLSRSDYVGIAGAGGQKYVAEALMRACSPAAVNAERVRATLARD